MADNHGMQDVQAGVSVKEQEETGDFQPGKGEVHQSHLLMGEVKKAVNLAKKSDLERI